MRVRQTLAWLCDEPRHSFTFNGILRQGWPGLANFFLLPRLLTLGRAARFVERTIFLGGMVGFVLFGGLPIPTLATKSGLIDAFELAFMVKAIALVAGLATQAALKIVEYFVGGFARVFPSLGGIDLKRYSRSNIDLKRYGPKGK
jgi:hypothetical protein